MKDMKVRLTLQEEILGTLPADSDVYRRFIVSKGPDAATREEEVESLGVDAVVEKGMTVFPKDENGNRFMYDYQVRGMFKDACGMLRKATGTESSKLKAYKKEIDGLIFILERKIPFKMEGDIDYCQRPLRAQTMQGERVSLAISETIPAGSTLEFTVRCLEDSDMKYVREWLDYGIYRGLGQWRNSGKGKFTWEEVQ